jgi:hypothetical protein
MFERSHLDSKLLNERDILSERGVAPFRQDVAALDSFRSQVPNQLAYMALAASPV